MQIEVGVMNGFKELREWIQLIFVVVGGVLAFMTFFQNLRQRRVENALKFVTLFRDGLHKEDMKHWHELFQSSSEQTGAKPGRYLKEWEDFRPISDYFSEGATDDNAIARMAASLDVVCHQVVSGAADARTVYYELGQLLNTMRHWLQNTDGLVAGQSLLQSYTSINEFFIHFAPQKASWPTRVYAFIK